MKKIVLITLIATFIIGALLGISMIFLDVWNEVTGNILFSTSIIFGFSIPGLACSTSYEKSKSKIFSLVGVITCVLSCLYLLALIWDILPFDLFDGLTWKIVLSSFLITSSFGHLSLLLLVNSENKVVKYFKYGTIICSVLIDVLWLLLIFAEIDVDWKVYAVLAILIVLGTIVTPLMSKLGNKTSNVKVNDNSDDENDKYKKIEQLKSLLDSNALTQEEFDAEKNKILNS